MGRRGHPPFRSRRGAALLVLGLMVVACTPPGSPDSDPGLAAPRLPAASTRSARPTTETVASPVVIDLPRGVDAFGILDRMVREMLADRSFRFEKRVHLATTHDTVIGSGFDLDVLWASGVVTPQGAEAGADESQVLRGLHAGPPPSPPHPLIGSER